MFLLLLRRIVTGIDAAVLLLFLMQEAAEARPHQSSRQDAGPCYKKNVTTQADHNLENCQANQKKTKKCTTVPSNKQHENVCRSSVAAPGGGCVWNAFSQLCNMNECRDATRRKLKGLSEQTNNPPADQQTHRRCWGTHSLPHRPAGSSSSSSNRPAAEHSHALSHTQGNTSRDAQCRPTTAAA